MSVDQAFEVHLLTDEGKTKARAIAAAFDKLLTDVAPLVGDARCLAITKTKLEEACFFAKKGMAKINGQPTE